MAIGNLVRGYFKGNESAVSFIEDFFAAWHIWDDLIDKDKSITDEAINQAFINVFIKLPRNTFYQIHFGILNPLMENAFINWFAANKLEQSKQNLETAYELRNTYLNIVITCANIIGGPREMHKAVCAECKKECEVPFKPREGGKPILCRECYGKSKGQSR